MELQTAYYGASGPTKETSCFLAQRFNKEWGYKPREGECLVVCARPDPKEPQTTIFGFPFITGDWLTGLWLSETQILYVASAFRYVLRNTRVIEEEFGVHRFENFEVPASLSGIWGLTDKCIFTWGLRFVDGVQEFPVFRWDGKAWKELPSPGFKVLSIHGVAPDFIVAVGHESGIASWDGRAWRRWASPVIDVFNSIFVVSPDEMYATGVGGAIIEGTRYGWALIARSPFSPIPLSGIAKWKGQLWIGGYTAGLLRRVGVTDQLEVVKPNIHAIGFDARQDLVITTSDRICSTADRINFASNGQGTVLSARAGKALNI